MVNPGHRSFGCAQCRRSKVKCDEARPACGRCTRTGRICSGYARDAPQFRSMNKAAEHKVQQRVRERLESRQPVRASSAPPLEDEYQSPPNTNPPLRAPPNPDWISQSVTLFFAENVEGPDHLQSTWGTFEFLPRLYQRARSAHLTEAVHAAALVNLANVSSVTELEQMARRAYGKALEGLSSAMNEFTRTTTDETLVTMNVLGIYEILAGQKPMTELFHAHFYGQSVILHTQKDNVAKGNSIFGITNRTLMWRDLAVGRRPYLCVSEWPTSTYSSSLGERTARFTLRVVDICGRAKEFSDQTFDDDAVRLDVYTELAADASELNAEIQEYFDSASEEWRPWSLPQRFPSSYPLDRNASIRGLSNLIKPFPSSTMTGPLYTRSQPTAETITPVCPPRIDVYPTKPVAFLWTSLRCARLHLLRVLIDLQLFATDHVVPAPMELPLIDETYDLIASTIEDVCATVPYFLGDVDQNGDLCTIDASRSAGYWLIWILHRICSIPIIDPGLRGWMVNVLTRIGNRGLKRGLFLAELHGN